MINQFFCNCFNLSVPPLSTASGDSGSSEKCPSVALKRVRPPTCFSLKIVVKLIYLDNAQYLTEYLTAAQLHLPKAFYIRAIRAVVINSFKVFDLQRSA